MAGGAEIPNNPEGSEISRIVDDGLSQFRTEMFGTGTSDSTPAPTSTVGDQTKQDVGTDGKLTVPSIGSLLANTGATNMDGGDGYSSTEYDPGNQYDSETGSYSSPGYGR